MLLFEHACVFFSRFLLSRNYKIQIAAHVGRKSAVVLSGIMEASYSHFFVGLDFNSSRYYFLVFYREAKTITQKPPDTLGIPESTSPRRALHDWWGDSSRGHHLEKKHTCNTSSQLWIETLLLTKNNLPRKSEKSVKLGQLIVTGVLPSNILLILAMF